MHQTSLFKLCLLIVTQETPDIEWPFTPPLQSQPTILTTYRLIRITGDLSSSYMSVIPKMDGFIIKSPSSFVFYYLKLSLTMLNVNLQAHIRHSNALGN